MTKQYTAKRYNTKVERWGTFTNNLAINLKEIFDCLEDQKVIGLFATMK